MAVQAAQEMRAQQEPAFIGCAAPPQAHGGLSYNAISSPFPHKHFHGHTSKQVKNFFVTRGNEKHDLLYNILGNFRKYFLKLVFDEHSKCNY